MKRLVAVFLSILIILSVFVGCSNDNDKKEGNTSPSDDNAKKEDNVTLTYLTLGGDWENMLPDIIEQYEKENENVQVKLEAYPFDQLFEVIEVKMGSGTKDFDVLAVDAPLVAAYTYRGYLEPLDEYFSEDDKDVLIPSSIEAGTVDGKFMAAPMNTSSQLMFYNKTLLKEAGVSLPSEDPEKRMTWEEVVEASQTVMEELDPDGSNGIWGLMFEQVSRPYQILALPNSLGGAGVGDDGITVDGIVNSPEWVEACKFYYDIFNTWKISPKGTKPSESQQRFTSGKVAFYVGGTWGTPVYEETEHLEYGYAPHPYFKDGKAATPTGSWHFGVNSESDHKKEAAEFVRYMSTGKGNDLWIEANHDLPSKKPLLEAIMEDEAYDTFPESSYKIAAYEAMNTAVPRPITSGYREWETIIGATLEDIRNGEDPKTALNDAVEQLDSALAKYKK